MSGIGSRQELPTNRQLATLTNSEHDDHSSQARYPVPAILPDPQFAMRQNVSVDALVPAGEVTRKEKGKSYRLSSVEQPKQGERAVGGIAKGVL